MLVFSCSLRTSVLPLTGSASTHLTPGILIRVTALLTPHIKIMIKEGKFIPVTGREGP
jgi:hypothetical protein